MKLTYHQTRCFTHWFIQSRVAHIYAKLTHIQYLIHDVLYCTPASFPGLYQVSFQLPTLRQVIFDFKCFNSSVASFLSHTYTCTLTLWFLIYRMNGSIYSIYGNMILTRSGT